MTVLNQFSTERTEIGLSDLARLSGLDKAATRRMLLALSRHGFIEQVQDTRKYRLGSGFLGLARIREATVPLARAAQEVCDWLTETTGETVHISVPMAHYMTTVAYALPNRSNIINISPAQPLPFHATAAGYAYMAAASPSTLKRALSVGRVKATSHTLVGKKDVMNLVQKTQVSGYAQCCNVFEDGVSSFAMAFFADNEEPAGTISIALPNERLVKSNHDQLLCCLKDAVTRIESAIVGHSRSCH